MARGIGHRRLRNVLTLNRHRPAPRARVAHRRRGSPARVWLHHRSRALRAGSGTGARAKTGSTRRQKCQSNSSRPESRSRPALSRRRLRQRRPELAHLCRLARCTKWVGRLGTSDVPLMSSAQAFVTRSCRNSPKSPLTTLALTPVLPKPISRSEMPRPATGRELPYLIKSAVRRGRHQRARDQIIGFISRRCPRTAAGNHWGLPPRFRVRRGCDGGAVGNRSVC
jgi:hypothetical protein